MEAPSLECALLVHEELKKIIYQVKLVELRRFSHLESQIKSIIEKLLAKLIIPTNEMIKNLFEVERGYINTRHPDFIYDAKESIAGAMGSDDEVDDIPNDKSTGGRKPSTVSKNAPLAKHPSDDPKQPPQSARDISSSSYSISPPHHNGPVPQPYSGTAAQHPTQGNSLQSAPFTGSTPLVHLSRIPEKLMIETKPSKREKNEVTLIKRMIVSYFGVVKKNINDLVPKAIITFFIKKTIDLSEKEMVQVLYDEKTLESVMREDQDVVSQRSAVQANIGILKECLVLVNEFEHSH